jgi:sirohydrochlorin ferrochelatase
MKALLLVAHGSRRAASNEEVRNLTGQLSGLDHEYDRVDCAFLELAEPSIPDGLRCAIASGADEIVVLPYFLSAGRHVTADIPAEVDTVRQEHPEVVIRVAPYLGDSTSIPGLLLEQASRKTG